MIERSRTVMPAVWAVAFGWYLGSAQPVAAQAYDPFEPVNRAIFEFNRVIDGMFIDPAQQVYGFVVPDPAKTGVRNFLDNLRGPVIFINDILQGERDRAGTTLSRFMINSTIGILGIFDAATALGFDERHFEDFGQTLGTYGVGPGPYLVLPILGPSSVRDAVGLGVDTFGFSPYPHVVDNDVLLTRWVVDGVDVRYRLDPALRDLEANSLDLYAAFRSVYQQRREADIRNGAAPVDDSEYEDIFEEEFDDQ